MLSLIVALSTAVAATGLDVGVTTLDGQTFDGRLQRFTSTSLEVETAGGKLTLAADELLSVIPVVAGDSAAPATSAAIQVVLVDGSQLRATGFTVADRRATIQLGEGGLARTTTDKIDSVRFQSRSQDPTIEQQWARILAEGRTGDVIVVRKTSPATRERPLATALDHLVGLLGHITGDEIGFEYDGTEINVRRSKVEGLLYHHQRRRTRPNMVCRLEGWTGSRWHAKSLRLRPDGLEIVSCAGVRYAMPLSQVAKLDYGPANLVFLGDLEPESESWRPHVFSELTPPSVSRWFRPREHTPMLLRGVEYTNGLALHSRTELTYRLSQEFRRFLASVGIDDRYRGEGNVLLRISGNRGVLFEGQIHGDQDPLELELDIRGVRRLTILVDFGQDGSDLGDHLNVCNARLTK